MITGSLHVHWVEGPYENSVHLNLGREKKAGRKEEGGERERKGKGRERERGGGREEVGERGYSINR